MTDREIAQQLFDALWAYAEWVGAVHIGDCPGDDTCSCAGKAINEKVSAVCKAAFGAGYKVTA